MPFDITRRIQKDTYDFEGISLRLDCSFDTILRVLELIGDELFDEAERILLGLDLIVLNPEELGQMDIYKLSELFISILKDECGIDLRTPSSGKPPVWDIYEDAERIYASFLKDYGIDLFEQQGIMHYRKFIALLLNLHEETAFKKVIGYRVMDVPKPDKYNTEYRKHILEMKRLYKLGAGVTDEERAEAAHQEMMAFAKGLIQKKGG